MRIVACAVVLVLGTCRLAPAQQVVVDGVSLGQHLAPDSLTDGYVGCQDSDTIEPFDPVALTGSIPLSMVTAQSPNPYPYDATMTPDGTQVWVADAQDMGNGGVTVVDRATNTIAGTVPLGFYTVGV